MRAHHSLLSISIVLASAGCGGPTIAPDGGTDARAPEADSGIRVDAGDGGSGPDGGPPPTPITDAVGEARTSLTAVETARDAIDPSMRLDAVHLTNDMLVVRLDAVIGEEGLIASPGVIGEEGSMTLLALPDTAVPTIVIVRQLVRSIEVIDEMVDPTAPWGRSTDTEIVALRTALSALREELVTLHDMLQARFREIIATVAIPLERENTSYADRRSSKFIAPTTTLHFIGEGASAASPTMQLAIACRGVDLVTITVTNEETDEMVYSMSMAPPSSTHTIRLTADDPAPLRVELDPEGTSSGWSDCDVILSGERHLRGAEIEVFPAEVGDLMTRSSTYDLQMSSLEASASSFPPTGPPSDMAVLAVVIDHLAELDATNGHWRVAPSVIAVEDLEVLELELGVLEAVRDTLQASPLLMTPTFQSIHDDLVDLRLEDPAALARLAEGDSSGT